MLWSVLRGGISSVWDFLFMLLGYVILLGIMMPVHEAAHAFAANRLGDPTARYMGRLTLNPLAHLDPIGSTLILLFGIGYAKPVPVQPRYFRDPRKGMALTALAGPLSNILLAVISIGLFRVIVAINGDMVVLGDRVGFFGDVSYYSYLVLVGVLARVNLSLAVFNLLPIPPLDGSRIFGAILPVKWTVWVDRYHEYVRMGVLLLIVTGILDKPLLFLTGAVGNGVCMLFGLPQLF